eukprot:snap_masked-scaffold_13-processed-gene-10.41-mRNA-1 protein AED:0.15 eAED:0.15 QI:0/-1/0/1/-1/1/1/0/1159
MLLFKRVDMDIPLNLQRSGDVFENVELEQTFENIVQELIYPAPLQLKFYYQSTKEKSGKQEISVKKLEAIPLSRVGTTYLDELAAFEGKEIDVKPILVSNILDEIPEPFQEIGIGEAEIKKKDERALLLELIDDHMDMCTLEENDRDKLRSLMVKKISAFGIHQSNAQMSLLSPIKCHLKPNHPPIVATGYHHTDEEEDFLAKKFQALEAAGIVKKNKNPRFGSPVFVVPKKIKKPLGFAEWDIAAKKQWESDNLLHRYRMVVNMKKLNDYTIRSPLDLPNLERQMRHLKGTRYYILLDILSGFDFLPTQENSQEIFTLVTRKRAFTMLGAPMGWCNTPQLFTERVVTEVIREHFNRDLTGACCWLDDIILYSNSVNSLLSMTTEILDNAIKKRVRFNLKKCEWIRRETIWCGRKLFDGRWNFAEEYFDKIAKAPFPDMKRELAQIIYLANWLSPAVPNMAKLRIPFAPLINLEGKKLKEIEKQQIKVEWTEDLRVNFRKLLKEIAKAAKLGFEQYDRYKPLLLFTDASGEAWSLALLQDEPENVTNDIKTLRPKPLLFLSGAFTDPQRKWHISSKELYPVLYSFERVGFMIRTHRAGIFLYMDHQALLAILRPGKKETKVYMDRLFRWSLKLQSLEMTVFHISSRENFLADLLSRWAQPEQFEARRIVFNDMSSSLNSSSLLSEVDGDSLERTVACFNAQVEHILDSIQVKQLSVQEADDREKKGEEEGDASSSKGTDNLGNNIEVMTAKETTVPGHIQDLKASLDQHPLSFVNPYYSGEHYDPLEESILSQKQKEMDPSIKKDMELKDGLLYFKRMLVIPRSLITRILITNHISKGHPSKADELKFLHKYYFEGLTRKNLNLLISSFRRRCLNCNRSPKLLRRSLNLIFLTNKPRELLHADYLYVNSQGYILAVTDNCTRKILLTYCKKANAEGIRDAILLWRSTLGLLPEFGLVTDNASHFANQTMELLSRALNFEQSFTIAYSAWTNGYIEVGNSKILHYLKVLCSEYSLNEEEWPKLVQYISYLINNRPNPRRKDYTPDELFFDLKPSYGTLEQESRRFWITLQNKTLRPKDVEQVKINTAKIQERIDERLDMIYDHVKLSRELERARRNKNFRMVVQFSPGDFVMLSSEGTPREKTKTALVWTGPYQITRIIS